MGLPVMTIIFASEAKESIKRSERGAVGMIVKDTVPEKNPAVVFKEKDIPPTLSDETKEQIQLALKGNVNAPSKVVVYVLDSADEDYTEALTYFELHKVNWLCCPTVETDMQATVVSSWVKEQREARNKVKAVLPNTKTDCEGVVNYTTESVTVGEKGYEREGFCSRIAGLLAGTPSSQGATYAVLTDAAGCTNLSKEELDTAIDGGEFTLFYDGEKVKVARAVNSLTTITDGKTEPWKKIKVVETMDMMHDDLVMLVEDNYIGKYQNTFDNKCLLLSAVKAYLDEIGRAGLIEDYEVDFDVDAIRDYLVENKGMSRDVAEAMKDAEVKKQYTDEKVFLKASVTVVDVMEDIALNITV